MGGHALVDGAAQAQCFSRLLLLDPTIFEPARYLSPHLADNVELAAENPAARRRNRFSSVAEMMKRLGSKSSFPLFEPRMFHDYCEFGLVPSPEGDLQLACPPAIEAQIYQTAISNSRIYDSVSALSIPVFVVRARQGVRKSTSDFLNSPTWAELATAFSMGKDLYLEDCSHFIPMERPDLVVALLREEVDAVLRTRH
jgi:lipase